MKCQQIIMKYAAISDSGHFRKENQDNVYCVGKYRADIICEQKYYCDGIAQNDAVFAVADGMGGEANGAEVAFNLVRGLSTLSSPIANATLTDFLLNYNADVCALIEQQNGKRMGATFVSLSVHDGIAETLNVGDSRVYLFRDKRLQCLSKDDTVIRSLIENGMLSDERAKKHPDRHRLTQHIGIFPDELLIEPHTTSFDVLQGDIFLLCSDGLTDALENEDKAISEVLGKQTEVTQKVNELFEMAYFKTRDNITIIVLELFDSEI